MRFRSFPTLPFWLLSGKNLGIVMHDADLDVAAAQCTLGGLSYNGQRCTAVKLVMVHASVAGNESSKMRLEMGVESMADHVKLTGR